tara:strand:+ start:661 stop:870 length:210 start_codon:yes stop_codon:yes gene_type:complete
MVWSTAEITYNTAGFWAGMMFIEIPMSDTKSLVTASQNDQDYWEDFTLATYLWENFITQTWEGTVFTEV